MQILFTDVKSCLPDYRCLLTDKIIRQDYVCDTVNDCYYGDDERFCKLRYFSCFLTISFSPSLYYPFTYNFVFVWASVPLSVCIYIFVSVFMSVCFAPFHTFIHASVFLPIYFIMILYLSLTRSVDTDKILKER